MATLIVAGECCHEHCICDWRSGAGVILHGFDMIDQFADTNTNRSGITSETVVTAAVTNQTNKTVIVIGVVWFV